MYQRVDLNRSSLPVTREQTVGSRAETSYATSGDIAALTSALNDLQDAVGELQDWRALVDTTLLDFEARISALEAP